MQAFIDTKKSEDCLKYPHIIKNENDAIPYFDYCNELILTGSYVGEYKLINTSLKYNCNLVIYYNFNYDPNSNNNIFTYETIINNIDRFNPFIYTI